MSSDDNLASWISGQCFWVSSVPASRYTQNGYLGQDFFFNPISIWYLEHGTWEWQITIMLISTNRYLHTDADKKPNLCQMIAVGFSDCVSANVFCPLLPHGQLTKAHPCEIGQYYYSDYKEKTDYVQCQNLGPSSTDYAFRCRYVHRA